MSGRRLGVVDPGRSRGSRSVSSDLEATARQCGRIAAGSIVHGGWFLPGAGLQRSSAGWCLPSPADLAAANYRRRSAG